VGLPVFQQKRIHKLLDRFIEQELLRLVERW
jgi:hypothetical protein